ncbi:hypothetical protein [Streptomyces hyderabadensis]|uniref:Uncharacterized protein n=1 Tax=Streptomyces hyderabadensis TaxID=598549 RepID=A0ABP9HHG4_9ACTN|nr:hypothetical protein [Streptomyces hyderabadensis]
MTGSPRPARRPSFGIMTPSPQVGYADLLLVWRAADGIPQIEHA